MTAPRCPHGYAPGEDCQLCLAYAEDRMQALAIALVMLLVAVVLFVVFR